MSPDGSLVATGSSGGVVRVWDTVAGDLIHEVSIGDQVIQGTAFINQQHLAVTPQEGDLLVVTIDTEELVSIARRSLTRGLTAVECDKFNFDDDCPTLEELQAG